MSSMRLARAVPCQWPSCRNMTKDPSFHCQHHQRSTQHALPQRYRDSFTILDRARASALVVTATKGSTSTWLDEAEDIGRRVMDQRPSMTVVGDDIIISHASDPAGDGDVAVDWNDMATLVPEGGRVLDGVRLEPLPDGGIKASPIDSDMAVKTKALAIGLTEKRWKELCKRNGVLDGYGEEYDDMAEILAQFNVSDDPMFKVAYSSKDDAAVKLSLFESVVDGSRVTESYMLYTSMDVDPRGAFEHTTHVIKPSMRGVFRKGKAPLIQPIDETMDPRREAIIHEVRTNMSLARSYLVRHDGKLYLPIGWVDR